jgi:threonine/homoserine/homoserine lactone efflux protein
VVRGLVRGGRRGGAATAAGVLCGLVVWVTATALGLSALLQASEIGYDVLKVARRLLPDLDRGASLLTVRRRADDVVTAGDGPMAPAPLLGGSGFFAGFLTDLLNPKVGVFFVSFLPGFVPDSGWSVGWTTFALGAWYTVLTALYFVGLIALSGTVAGWMRSPGIRRRLDTLTGLVLVGFGVRLATEA